MHREADEVCGVLGWRLGSVEGVRPFGLLVSFVPCDRCSRRAHTAST